VLDRLPLGVSGVLDVTVPGALPPTPYSRGGELPLLGVLALVLGWLALLRRDRA
jgi:apolipoprotein N-acyltransferase